MIVIQIIFNNALEEIDLAKSYFRPEINVTFLNARSLRTRVKHSNFLVFPVFENDFSKQITNSQNIFMAIQLERNGRQINRLLKNNSASFKVRINKLRFQSLWMK
jgi:hypothetical protein